MENLQYIGKVDSKHGIINFCHNDIFMGLAIREYGEYSEIELTLMSKFIQSGDYVFDIGTNIGCFSIPFSKKVGKEGKIFSFEPQKFLFSLLKKNIEDNRIYNIEPFSFAVGKKPSYLILDEFDYSKNGNFGGVTLSEKYDNANCAEIIKKGKHKVKVVTLDNFLRIKKCDFIKIDVELMELDVLKGGKNFLEKFRPILWIENHYETKQNNQINEYLIRNGYSPYWIVSRLFNPENYFINDQNYFTDMITINTLAIPNKKLRKYNIKGLDKVLSSRTKPKKIITTTRDIF